MIPSGVTAIICLLVATVAGIQGVLYIGDWYGFACLFLSVSFALVGAILWKDSW